MNTSLISNPLDTIIGDNQPYNNISIDLQDGDMIYIFSDGYPDQFGGPPGKKFKYRPFKELLISMNDKMMSEQGDILKKHMTEWKGELEQIDDICILGVRI